ncbi:conserved repeat domain-containing protein [Bifidobacterium bohemicum]|uniref:DUF7927 domain-containing protein n=2 Tax=Bifidobacterium bohemicum TaxID=638617 RepID=A0A086ZEZ6_9BIFI|nr:DUF11 domain-containing protein [Bifidobacterium bohemicum]KFI45096.1 hypothetical protein BBOH_1358 [Bifidobacterium bohemicum DSM 22767]SCB91697.1 conserved repeat domain-containing protein [Bifidobacterium bohemicum]
MWGSPNNPPPATALTNKGDDGLVVTASPDTVVKGSPNGVTLTIDDSNTSNADFNEYLLSGIPQNWSVYIGNDKQTPVSPDPIIYSIRKSSHQIRIVPPADFSGPINTIQISRNSNSPNLITDFDKGTFDYIGQSHPQLPAGSTPYKYHDPQTAYTDHIPTQYGPLDGDYSIWPTGDMNGPDLRMSDGTTRHPYNNYWADLRSISHPMNNPTSAEITQNWKGSSPDNEDSANTRTVSDAESSASGKILVVNGSLDLPIPHDIITTTVYGLKQHTNYTMNGYVANLSDYPYSNKTVAPVQLGFVVNGKFIGTSQESPKQPSALNSATKWTPISSVVNTGDSDHLTISARNYKAGGWGNDFAIDQLSLYPQATAKVDLDVKTPGYEFSKTSDPVTGSRVMPGQTITYTLEGRNTGQTDLPDVVIDDDLTDVLKHADLVGQPASSTGDAPAVADGRLSWKGSLDQDKNVTITYKVRIHDGDKAAWNVTFKNHATSQATPPGDVPPITPPAGQTEHHTPPQPVAPETPKLGMTGSNIVPIAVITLACMLAASFIWFERSSRRNK